MKKEDVVKELRARFKDANVNNIEGTVAIQIDLKDDNLSNIYVEVKDKVLSIEPYEYWDRNAIITANSKDLLDVIDKKIDLEKAVEGKLISTDGDVQKCIEILKLSKGIPAKETKVSPKKVIKENRTCDNVKKAEVKTAVKAKQPAKNTKTHTKSNSKSKAKAK